MINDQSMFLKSTRLLISKINQLNDSFLNFRIIKRFFILFDMKCWKKVVFFLMNSSCNFVVLTSSHHLAGVYFVAKLFFDAFEAKIESYS